MEIIEGKWYINTTWMSTSILRFSKMIGNSLDCSEAFVNRTKWEQTNPWYTNEFTREATKQEIRDFLPIGYKFNNNITIPKLEII